MDTASPRLSRFAHPAFAWPRLTAHLAPGLCCLKRGWGAQASVLFLFLVAAATACRPADRSADAGARVDRTWPVMGTILSVTAEALTEAGADTAVEEARHAVFRVDSLMSTYKPESEISVLNGRAGTGEWTALSPWTEDVLAAALHWAEVSDGAFDPTVGPLMVVWGFRREEGPSRPDSAAVAEAESRVGWRHVTLDRDGHRARLEGAGMALDFGGLAKGYAVDRAIEAARRKGVTHVMVDLGGDLAVFGPPPKGKDRWALGIRHPRHTDDLMGRLLLVEGSVATSGDYEQMFEQDGIRYSHIMDPRTGAPSRGVVAVTVAARDGLTADVLSTTLFVMGPEAGRHLLARERPRGVTAVWVRDSADGRVDAGDVVVGGDTTFARVEVDLGG